MFRSGFKSKVSEPCVLTDQGNAGAAPVSGADVESSGNSAKSSVNSAKSSATADVKPKRKRGMPVDAGIGVCAIGLTIVLSLINHAIGPASDHPRSVSTFATVGKQGDPLLLLSLKLRLARQSLSLSGPAGVYICNIDLANYYLWTGSFVEAEKYLNDARAVWYESNFQRQIFYSLVGASVEQKQWDDAAIVADVWANANCEAILPSSISDYELMRMVFLETGRTESARQMEERISRCQLMDGQGFTVEPRSRSGDYDPIGALGATCRTAQEALAAGRPGDARRYLRFLIETEGGREGDLTWFYREKATLLLPIASLLAGDMKSAAAEFPAALNEIKKYNGSFSARLKGVVYKHYADFLRRQGDGKNASTYEKLAARYLTPTPVLLWWNMKDPVDPWH